MRILVTGASGFLGAHLVGRLTSEGHEVFVLPSPHFRGERLSGLRYQMVNRADGAAAEVVYHLAGTPIDGSGHERAVVGGMTRLLDELRECSPRRLVIAGSAAEYGSGAGWREDDTLRPDTVLGALKHGAAELARASGIPTVNLRLFTPFGEGESPTRLVPSAARAAMAREAIRLRSAGTRTRDYFHVTDLMDAFVEAGRRPLDPGISINICTGVERRAIDVARRVAELAGSTSPVETGTEEPNAMARSSGDPTRARQVLGWWPRVDFDEGLRRSLRWWAKEQQAA
jgi:nucleoside-diphosphate-sugar epimerase